MMTTIKVKPTTRYSPVIRLDGKKIKFKKAASGMLEADVDVAEGTVMEINNWNTIAGGMWFLTEMFYFFIGIFGIFDTGREKFNMAFRFRAVLHPVQGSQITVGWINSQQEGSPAVEFIRNFEAEITDNAFYGQKQFRKRRRIARFAKFVIWLALIGAAIAIVAKTMG